MNPFGPVHEYMVIPFGVPDRFIVPVSQTGLLLEAVAIIAAGSVIVTGTFDVQSFESLIVIIYEPAVSPVNVAETWYPPPFRLY
jgi:hypothetical protein